MGRCHLNLGTEVVTADWACSAEKKSGLQAPGWERGRLSEIVQTVWGSFERGARTSAAQRLRKFHGSRRRDRWIPDPGGESQPAPL